MESQSGLNLSGPYNTIGKEEIKYANTVLDSGLLSGYIAAPGEYFLGGEWTKELESKFCEKFGTKFAISVNSATSGLHAAVAAAGVEEGDEVIVSAKVCQSFSYKYRYDRR